MNRFLSLQQTNELFLILEKRFQENSHRHENQNWEEIKNQLESNPSALWSVFQMEETGGEPDFIQFDELFYYVDCSQETPAGRRSLCFDQAAWNSRKQNKPFSSAEQEASNMNIQILTEEEYRELQKFGPFDLKTSTWLQTPESIRKLGGALFGDHRFGRTFIYHNGAESYYAVRGFRGKIRI